MRIPLALLLTSTALPVLAHPGDHHEGTVATLHHLFTEPDHLAMMAIAVLVGVSIAAARRRGVRKSEDRRDPR